MFAEIFQPASIAVVGASRNRQAVGRRILDALVSGPFQGAVYAVNPSAAHVGAVPCHESLGAIGRAIDLVVVAIPADAVEKVVSEAADVGARNVIVVSAGFAESGDEGARLQQALVDLAHSRDIRVVGPNCLGVLTTDPDVNMNASFAPELPPPGNVGLCSQSGALGIATIDLAGRLGLGLSTFVSLGNQADVSVVDVLDYWGEDDRTAVGLMYLESITDPQRFRETATQVTRRTPLVIVKSGTSDAGSRAASSHTAALAGSDRAVDALLEQSGVMRAASLDDMFGIGRILANQPAPSGRRTAIVTNSGGPAVLCVDALHRAGFRVDELDEAAQQRIAEHLPDAASVLNPIDMLADADAEAYARVVEEVLSLDDVDVLVVIYTPIGLESPTAVRDSVHDAVARARSGGAEGPVLMSIVGGGATADSSRGDAQGETIPTFDFPEDLARMLGPIGDRVDWLDGDRGTVAEFADQDLDEVRAVIDASIEDRGDGWLSVDDARAVLAAAGVRLNAGRVVTSASDACEVATEIGFPVAVSIASTDIVHKTDEGGVHLDLETVDDVEWAFDAITDLAEREGVDLDGALVAGMEGGVELFVGVQRDPVFGPLVGFGLGGVMIEVLEDVVFRLAPMTNREAVEQVRSIRGRRLLEGYRGSSAVDIDAVVETVQRISALVDAVPEIDELDINPLFARADAVVATDVRISVSRK